MKTRHLAWIWSNYVWEHNWAAICTTGCHWTKTKGAAGCWGSSLGRNWSYCWFCCAHVPPQITSCHLKTCCQSLSGGRRPLWGPRLMIIKCYSPASSEVFTELRSNSLSCGEVLAETPLASIHRTGIWRRCSCLEWRRWWKWTGFEWLEELKSTLNIHMHFYWHRSVKIWLWVSNSGLQHSCIWHTRQYRITARW